MVTLLADSGRTDVEPVECRDEELWLNRDEVERATGWSLRREGLCRGDVCVPIPGGREGELVRAEAANVAALWRHRGAPVIHDRAREVWVLGEPAADRAAQLRSLEAPDFTLPDLDGRLHSLREHRGRKVLLVSWASW